MERNAYVDQVSKRIRYDAVLPHSHLARNYRKRLSNAILNRDAHEQGKPLNPEQMESVGKIPQLELVISELDELLSRMVSLDKSQINPPKGMTAEQVSSLVDTFRTCLCVSDKQAVTKWTEIIDGGDVLTAMKTLINSVSVSEKPKEVKSPESDGDFVIVDPPVLTPVTPAAIPAAEPTPAVVDKPPHRGRGGRRGRGRGRYRRGRAQ